MLIKSLARYKQSFCFQTGNKSIFVSAKKMYKCKLSPINILMNIFFLFLCACRLNSMYITQCRFCFYCWHPTICFRVFSMSVNINVQMAFDLRRFNLQVSDLTMAREWSTLSGNHTSKFDFDLFLNWRCVVWCSFRMLGLGTFCCIFEKVGLIYTL